MIQTILGYICNLFMCGQPRVHGVAMHLPNQGGYVGLMMAGATILGSSMQANAAKNAAGDQTQGQTNALNSQIQQFNTVEGMLDPYREAGFNSLNALLSMDRLPLDKTQFKPFAPIATYAAPGNSVATTRDGRGRGADPAGIMKDSTANTMGQIGDPANLLGGFFAKGGVARGGHMGKAFVVGEPDPVTGQARPEILHMAPGSVGYVQPNPMTPGAHMPHRMLGGPVYGEPTDTGLHGGNHLGSPLGPVSAMPGTPHEPIDPGFSGLGLAHGGTPSPATAKTPGAESAQPYNFRADPGYKFAYNQGLSALEDNNAANGLLHSTANTRMAIRYGQGMADQEYNNIYNRILAISGLGSGANGNASQYASGASAGIANTFGNIGNAGASGDINAGNAYANGLNSLGGLYSLYRSTPKSPDSSTYLGNPNNP